MSSMLLEYVEIDVKRRSEAYGRAMKQKLVTLLFDYFPQTYEDPLGQRAEIVANEVWDKCGPDLVANKQLRMQHDMAKLLGEMVDV